MKHESPIGKVLDRLVAAEPYLARLNVVLAACLGGMIFALIIENWWY